MNITELRVRIEEAPRIPLGVWPTDHKGVLATFVLGQQ